MTSHALPAFGEADLSNCEREQIHLAGSIQPHGVLLVLDETGETIVQASGNAVALLGLDGQLVGTSLVGQRLDALPGTLGPTIRRHAGAGSRRRAIAVRARVGAHAVDALAHRPNEGGPVVELEPAGPAVRPGNAIADATRRLGAARTLRALADETALIVRDLTGYDRVMVYRFDPLGHGEVFSECREGHLEAFLGNRYPASDIPQIARRLYLQNRIRLLVDVDYEPVPIVPRLNPSTGRDLDMSLCGLRSMSPIHLQYLRNMGVRATLVISLVVGGELWGLIACHHYAPRFIPFETRALCEILAEVVATRVAALQGDVRSRTELSVRRLETAMAEAAGGDWQAPLLRADDGAVPPLLDALDAAGAAILFEGQVRTVGAVPDTLAIRALASWLDGRPRAAVYATAALGREAAGFEAIVPVAAGVAAVPLSSAPGEYLLWVRPERHTTVTWGGDPTKPVIVGSDPRQLSPRLSFAQWHEVVECTSDPWTPADLASARLVGRAVSSLVLQLRSARLLVAQDEFDALSRQVRGAFQPVLLADAGGRVVLMNEAFAGLIGAGHAAPRHLDDLPRLFTGSLSLVRRIDDLLGAGRPFRTELALAGGHGPARPYAVAAEPVAAADGRPLGFIVLGESLADRAAAEDARRALDEDVRDLAAPRAGQLDDPAYDAAYAGIADTARLAAVAVTGGAEPDALPPLIEGIRASLARTADLLEHLVWHGSGLDGEAG